MLKSLKIQKTKQKTDSNKNSIIASMQHAKEDSIATKHFPFILTNLNVPIYTNTILNIQNAVMDSKPAAKPSIQNKHKTNHKFGIDPDYQNATSDESQNYLYPETTDDDITYNILHSTSNASINTNTN